MKASRLLVFIIGIMMFTVSGTVTASTASKSDVICSVDDSFLNEVIVTQELSMQILLEDVALVSDFVFDDLTLLNINQRFTDNKSPVNDVGKQNKRNNYSTLNYNYINDLDNLKDLTYNSVYAFRQARDGLRNCFS